MSTPTDPDFFQAATDPNDPAVKTRRILESIARKQAKAPAVDANGYPLPDGSKRWSR